MEVWLYCTFTVYYVGIAVVEQTVGVSQGDIENSHKGKTGKIWSVR